MMTETDNKKRPLMHRYTLATVLIVTGGFALTAEAQQSDGLLVDVDACIELATRAEQVACYEERVNEALRSRGGEAESSGSSAATAESNAVEPEQSRATRRAERQAEREAERRAREVERRQRAAEEAAVAAAEAVAALEDTSYTAGEIVGEIVELREMEPDAYIITLDNGQVWRQSQPKRYPLFVGSRVELRPSVWGPSYRLTDPTVGNFIQVRRVN